MLRIEYYRNALCGRRCFLEEFHPLGRHFIREERDPGEILAWPRKRYGDFCTHGAIATTTDDRDCAFASLEQWLDHISANGEQNIRLLRNKFGGQSRKLIRFTVGIAEDDFDVATVNKSGLSECSPSATDRSGLMLCHRTQATQSGVSFSAHAR
jgi:hypothetical protein